MSDELIPVEHDEPPYPPIGTEEACLIIALDCEQFMALGHTGRYMHGQCACAGVDGPETGIRVPDDLDPGYWVMRNGRVYGGGPYWTPYGEEYDDPEVSGDWRKARRSDFDHFNVDWPMGDP